MFVALVFFCCTCLFFLAVVVLVVVVAGVIYLSLNAFEFRVAIQFVIKLIPSIKTLLS